MDRDVSLLRLCVLRATYLLLVVGLGAMILPPLFRHEPAARGVIPSLLAAVWVLALLGLRHPLRMLPVLMFELAWKVTWLAVVALPLWASGRLTPAYGAMAATLLWVAPILLVVPWDQVARRFVRARGDRWR